MCANDLRELVRDLPEDKIREVFKEAPEIGLLLYSVQGDLLKQETAMHKREARLLPCALDLRQRALEDSLSPAEQLMVHRECRQTEKRDWRAWARLRLRLKKVGRPKNCIRSSCPRQGPTKTVQRRRGARIATSRAGPDGDDPDPAPDGVWSTSSAMHEEAAPCR